MLRRLTVRGAAAMALVVGTVLVVSLPASASPIQLLIPQSTAFSVLGHSCGGIQEKVYANGFDPTTGYPTGDAYLSTSCGGSGRGGGYTTTTYSAWVSATWDFTGALVSYQTLSAAPAVNPTFSAYDSYGNEVYNQSGSAFLVLAAGFVPAPRVTAISPTAGPAAGGTSVTITGTGFSGATAVFFGGSAAASFTVASDTSMTAVSPAAAAGTVDLTVSSSGGTSATSSADQFTFVVAPTVSRVNPDHGWLQGGTSVTISGSGFTGATAVDFGGTFAGFTVDSDTSITATAPVGEGPDTVDVTVTTIGGTSATSSADQFTYVGAPTVSSVSPNHGGIQGGTSVTISGSDFTGATAVDFGGTPATTFTVNSDSSITAVSPASGSSQTVDVTVTTPGGTSATSSADQFTYTILPLLL